MAAFCSRPPVDTTPEHPRTAAAAKRCHAARARLQTLQNTHQTLRRRLQCLDGALKAFAVLSRQPGSCEHRDWFEPVKAGDWKPRHHELTPKHASNSTPCLLVEQSSGPGIHDAGRATTTGTPEAHQHAAFTYGQLTDTTRVHVRCAVNLVARYQCSGRARGALCPP